MAIAPFDTYTQLGQAEDFQDEIHLISPVDAPVASKAKKLRATAKTHEWLEDELAAAGKNAHAEGAPAPDNVDAPVVPRSNYCQIMTKTASVSGTLEKVDKYGRDSEMSYQLYMKYAELANDEEMAIMGKPGGTRQVGNDGSGNGGIREMASLFTQIDANNKVDGSTYTTVDHLEAGVLEAHQACYDAGGNPNFLVTNPANSLYVAQFAQAAGRHREIQNGTQDRSVINVVELIVSPFGELTVILDRNAADDLTLIDFEYLSVPILRATRDWELGKTGDSMERQVLRESTVAVHNSKAHAAVHDVATGLTPPA